MTVNQETIELIKKWATVLGPDDCWNFHKKNVVKNGTGRLSYGQVTYLNKKWRAHRLAAHLAFGNIPDGAQVCHKCDNTLCLNPNHLFFGSNYDNVRDKMKKGRHRAAFGEESGHSKLTNEETKQILETDFSTVTQEYIAKKYGVSQPLISMILSGKVRSKCV